MFYFKMSYLAGGNRLCRCVLRFVVLIGLLGSTRAFAQQLERIRVKVGEKIKSHEFATATYRFPGFDEGIIYYTSGGQAKGKLNYHQLLGEMHFIGPKGDTLALDNLYLVKHVALGDARFYYDPKDKGFGEEVADFNAVKLLIKHKFKPSDRERGVAYGQYSNTSATTNYSTYAVNGQIQKLSPNEYLVYSKKANYYLSDQNNHFYPVNKASVLKIFSRHKMVVEKFLKENRIDFQKEEDLKKLLAYCTGLS